MNRLAGKIAIVTVGAVGIGRACGQRMAEEGAKVAILDMLETEGRDLAAELTAAGYKAAFWAVDVTDEAKVKAAIDAAAGRFESLHVMENNAGIPTAATGRTRNIAWLRAMPGSSPAA